MGCAGIIHNVLVYLPLNRHFEKDNTRRRITIVTISKGTVFPGGQNVTDASFCLGSCRQVPYLLLRLTPPANIVLGSGNEFFLFRRLVCPGYVRDRDQAGGGQDWPRRRYPTRKEGVYIAKHAGISINHTVQ